MKKVQSVREKRLEYVKARARKGYKYARSLGLDSYEAGKVCQWSKGKIFLYAESII